MDHSISILLSGYNYRLGHNVAIDRHPNCYKWVETIVQVLRNSELEATMAIAGNPNSKRLSQKKLKAIEWRRKHMEQLDQGNIDLLSYQQKFLKSPSNKTIKTSFKQLLEKEKRISNL